MWTFGPKSLLAAGCCALLFVAGYATQARADVTPLLNCADFNAATNTESGMFGYDNSGTDVHIDIGPNNFFSPGVLFRGQPTDFSAGEHDRVFATSFQISASLPQVSWTLNGSNVVILKQTSEPPCELEMRFLGPWLMNFQYQPGFVVTHDNATWLASTSTTGEPGVSGAWTELGSLTGGPQGATGATGPQGATGASGATGPAGPNGVTGATGSPGASGANLTFPSSQSRTLSRRGRLLVHDTHVVPDSVITIQYVGKAGKPTSVRDVKQGSFVVTGSPRHRFDYVVFNQP